MHHVVNKRLAFVLGHCIPISTALRSSRSHPFFSVARQVNPGTPTLHQYEFEQCLWPVRWQLLNQFDDLFISQF
jgi:hypothetical protein